MNCEKYRFCDHSKIKGSSYIFQMVESRKLSNIYHSHEFYEILLLLSGSVLHIVNGSELAMSSGDCVILTPSDAHSFSSQSEDMRLLGLSVMSSEFLKATELFGIKRLPQGAKPFSCSERIPELKAISERCCSASDSDSDKALLLCSILSCIKGDFQSGSSDIPQLLLSAAEQMAEEANLKSGIPALTELTNYSYPHLFRLMKRYYNQTPHEFVSKLRFDTAYSRIIHSDMPIEDIAEQIGFKSFSHFTTAFKQRFGISPAALRKSSGSMYF